MCIHPNDDLESKKKYFSDFEVVKYQTRENIYKAFIVLFFESTAIIDAILLKKRVVTIISNAMDENQIKAGFHWIKELGIEKINIDDDIIVDAESSFGIGDNIVRISISGNDRRVNFTDDGNLLFI